MTERRCQCSKCNPMPKFMMDCIDPDDFYGKDSGACKEEHIVKVYVNPDGSSYFEQVCLNCGASTTGVNEYDDYAFEITKQEIMNNQNNILPSNFVETLKKANEEMILLNLKLDTRINYIVEVIRKAFDLKFLSWNWLDETYLRAIDDIYTGHLVFKSNSLPITLTLNPVEKDNSFILQNMMPKLLKSIPTKYLFEPFEEEVDQMASIYKEKSSLIERAKAKLTDAELGAIIGVKNFE